MVALVAAYGLALQALLAAFAVPAVSPDPTICAAGAASHGAARGDAPPAPHGPDCTICPLACAGAATLPPAAAAAVRVVEAASAPRPQPAAASVRPGVLRAGLARAPPA